MQLVVWLDFLVFLQQLVDVVWIIFSSGRLGGIGFNKEDKIRFVKDRKV